MTKPITLRTPNEGRTIAVVGDVYRFLATGEETDGRYAMWEAIHGYWSDCETDHRVEATI